MSSPMYVFTIINFKEKTAAHRACETHEDSEKMCARSILLKLEEMIKNGFLNMKNISDRQRAMSINNMIKNNNVYAATNIFNTISDDFHTIVYCHPYKARDIDDPKILSQEIFDHVYEPSGLGATCRKCKASNEYAAAENSAGTYLCTGCKIMTNVFT